MQIITPWKLPEFINEYKGRSDLFEYAKVPCFNFIEKYTWRFWIEVVLIITVNIIIPCIIIIIANIVQLSSTSLSGGNRSFQKHNISLPVSPESPWSVDWNLMHVRWSLLRLKLKQTVQLKSSNIVKRQLSRKKNRN